jgi:hypothetical protein
MANSIVIGYCHNGMNDEPFLESLLGFLAYDSNSRHLCQGALPEKGLYLDDNRNNNTRAFLKTKGDWFLSLDTDMEFHPTVPYELFDEAVKHDRPIISALYFSFIIDGKLRPVWFIEGDGGGGVKNIGRFRTGEIVPLAAAGMGCCLIRRDVFETIAKQDEYKNDSWTWYGREPFTLKGMPAHLGEDVSLCLRAGRLGLKTWGHGGVESGHWKKMKLDFNLFRLFYEDAKRRGEEY